MSKMDGTVCIGERTGCNNSSHKTSSLIRSKCINMIFTMKILSDNDVLQSIAQKKPYQSSYRAFFSSQLGGITLNPAFMQVPIDDHMVHRGDGVFEAFKSIDRKIYLLNAHLDRLELSAGRLGIKLPMPRAEIETAILETLKASGLNSSLVRLYVSRGPGGFSPNPYESVGSQLYVVATDLKQVPEKSYQDGVSADFSEVVVKEGLWAQVKSCNYLPNVMMKKESVDKKVDFMIGVDSAGHLTEGSTENLAWVNSEQAFCYPKFDNTLRGTTLLRLVDLLGKKNLMKTKEVRAKKEDLMNARAIFMIGTTLDVLPVTKWAGAFIESKYLGHDLRKVLLEDQKTGDVLTAY